MKITEKYILPDGTIVDELPEEYEAQFSRRLTETFIPFAYEAVMEDLRREKASRCVEKDFA